MNFILINKMCLMILCGKRTRLGKDTPGPWALKLMEGKVTIHNPWKIGGAETQKQSSLLKAENS